MILGDVAETTSPIDPADYQAYEVILLLFDSKCKPPNKLLRSCFAHNWDADFHLRPDSNAEASGVPAAEVSLGEHDFLPDPRKPDLFYVYDSQQNQLQQHMASLETTVRPF